tara:strand:+ start:87 stop:794 length:708 start_codon:yes stop_codon:yes gene_type:complete
MIYGFIPARSGSTRLPGKNMMDLGGKPLTFWTIDSALQSKKIDKIIFSSNSEQYIKKVNDYFKTNENIFIFDKRDEKHSRTKSKIFDYLKSDLIQKCKLSDNDILVQLLPTSPLRNSKHIDEAVDLCIQSNKGVFSVCEYDFHLSFAMELENNSWYPLLKNSPLITGNTQSQDQTKYFHPNGSINCLPVNLLKKKNSSIYIDCIAYLMDKIDSFDIDTHSDLKIVEAILGYRAKQ